MNDQELQILVENISLESFAKPFIHRAYFNRRLKTTGGRYHVQSHNIDINPKMLSEHSKDVLIGVIKHELCHYHLHLAGYSGKHNTLAFKRLLKTVGGSRYAPAPVDNRPLVYICSHCGQTYRRKRKIDVKKYVCGKCRGKLELKTGDD
ncbi:SprT family protein [Apilactobacillus apinorum]|uniref:SprT family protein n=1 Tax=Apilactobacillus apinorum TaxID=1218495 RepID=A0ABP9ZGI7_9LACO